MFNSGLLYYLKLIRWQLNVESSIKTKINYPYRNSFQQPVYSRKIWVATNFVA